MEPENHVLWGCSALPTILPRSHQLCQNGSLSVLSSIGETENYFGRGRQTCCLRQKFTKFRGEIISYFLAVALIRHCSMRNWLFGLSGRILCEHSSYDEYALGIALHLSHVYTRIYFCPEARAYSLTVQRVKRLGSQQQKEIEIVGRFVSDTLHVLTPTAL
jgi:hypothetical protein